VTEPAGALALAGLKRYIVDNKLVGAKKKFVAVVSGANMNFDRLRFVAERAELGEGREALLSVDIPEKPGRSVQVHNPAVPFCDISTTQLPRTAHRDTSTGCD
jgi:threonine dehydratase